MVRAYSLNLRERVAAAVAAGDRYDHRARERCVPWLCVTGERDWILARIEESSDLTIAANQSNGDLAAKYTPSILRCQRRMAPDHTYLCDPG